MIWYGSGRGLYCGSVRGSLVEIMLTTHHTTSREYFIDLNIYSFRYLLTFVLRASPSILANILPHVHTYILTWVLTIPYNGSVRGSVL